MDKKIFIELFRFNHKTDYLPYYKKYEFSYENEDRVKDLLNKINSIEEFSFEGTDKFGIKINNYFTTVDTLIDNIVSKTSNELVIEPVSSYRAVNDLTINNEDFFEKMELFGNFLSSEQKEHYADKLQVLYYASNTLNFNKAYVGDHMLLIADDIIKENPSAKNEVFNILKDNKSGGWFHTSLDKRVIDLDNSFKEKIDSLLLELTGKTAKESSHLESEDLQIAQKFTNFNIAVYDKDDTSVLENFVTKSDAKCVNTASKNDDLALHCIGIDKSFSYKIAGNVLLDAKDSNADFMVVKDEEIFKIFDNDQKEISKAVGREIDLPIVTFQQFTNILSGEKDPVKLGFKKHKVAVNFL